MEITLEQINSYMKECTLCPRRCHADRLAGVPGFCGQTSEIKAARAALHFWEEPCICPDCGSGAVFFSGCSLKCIFCQNYDISMEDNGKKVSLQHLSEIFLMLQETGAANINLVTAGHFIPQVAYSLAEAKRQGLSIPVVYNSSGYEEVSSLRLLEGLVDIYLPDLKYFSRELSAACSHAPDYFDKASSAIAEMFRQTGPFLLESEGGLMKSGLIVRHLLLPGHTGDSKKILRYLHNTYGNDIYISIMNQYTPMTHVSQDPNWNLTELRRPVTEAEYEKVLLFAERIGIEKGFRQEGGTAAESFIPSFNGEGL